MRLRTLLFVPGDRPDRIAKAYRSGADAIVVDFEDAVAATAKDAARAAAPEAIAVGHGGPCRTGVRINALDTGLAEDDIRALAPVLDRIDLMVVPMVSNAAAVRRAAALLGDAPTRLLPLVETAAGVLAARDIAAADPRVHTLTFGPADLSRELTVTPTADGPELLFARSQVVLAAAAAGRVPPIDGPYLQLQDDAGLARSAASARRLGFAGKQVIHPRQIDAVRAAFTTDSEQLAWARAVDRAFTEAERRGVSSIQLDDGTFVDYPIARRARALLAAEGER
jgi:citrate lyase subunit beta/citryl-CoA lyase